MGLGTIHLPKALKDEMDVRIGVNGHLSAPEKINTDSVQCVYDLSPKTPGAIAPLHAGIFTDSIAQPAYEEPPPPVNPLFLNPWKCLIWGRDSGAAGMVSTSWYPNEVEGLKSYLALRYIRHDFFISELGLAALSSYPTEIHCHLKAYPYPLNGSVILAKWKWNIGNGSTFCPAQTGHGLVGDGFLNEVPGSDNGAADAYIDKCVASTSVVSHDPKGLILPPIADWYFEWWAKGYNSGDPIIWPYETAIKSTILAEHWNY